jgi:hypothetical protein
VINIQISPTAEHPISDYELVIYKFVSTFICLGSVFGVIIAAANGSFSQ